jgi:predicted GNAT family N-acyltransferase
MAVAFEYAATTPASAEDREACHALRRRVFTEEQGVAASIEQDGRDTESLFVAARRDGEVIGCLRFRPSGDVVKIERVAMHPDHRRHGVGRAIMACMEQEAIRLYPGKLLFLHSQESSNAFYDALGYMPIGDPFEEADIPHQAYAKITLPGGQAVRLERLESGPAPEAARRLIADVLHEYGLETEAYDRDLLDLATTYGRGGFFVIHTGGRLAGTAAWSRIQDQTAEIRRMFLAPPARGLSLGSQLLVLLERDAAYRGCTRAVLETASALREAKDLYLHHGYRQTDEPTETRRCDLRMEKALRRA